MKMKHIVLKFGGSIFKTSEDLTKITDEVQANIVDGWMPVCVVSAASGTTDRLIRGFEQMSGDPTFNPHRFCENLLNYHLPMLPHDADDGELRQECSVLEEALSRVKPQGDLIGSEYAYIVSRGESLGMRILSSHLSSRGIRNRCFCGEDILVTDENSSDAAINLDETRFRVEKHLVPSLTDGYVPVVAGFAGRGESGSITILGRGGSDDTAACLAYCLGVRRVIKLVDEGGITTLDRKFLYKLREDKDIAFKVGPLPEPRLVPYLSYPEASELLREERTKVVHFKALDPLIQGGIRLELKSLGNSVAGTIIGPENGDQVEAEPKAMSFQRGLSCIRLQIVQSALPTSVYAEVFGSLAKAGVDVLYQSTSGYLMTLFFVSEDVNRAIRALSEAKSVMDLKLVEGTKGTISVIVPNLGNVRTLLLNELAGHGVNVEQATLPNCSNILRFSVADADLPLAVATIYKKFLT